MKKTLKALVISSLLAVSSVVGYNATYLNEDMDNIFADIIGHIGTNIIQYISVLVILLVIFLSARVLQRIWTGGGSGGGGNYQ